MLNMLAFLPVPNKKSKAYTSKQKKAHYICSIKFCKGIVNCTFSDQNAFLHVK